MTAIAAKFRDFFSDLWLNIELMFTRKPKKSAEETTQTLSPEAAAPTAPTAPGIMPVSNEAPTNTAVTELLHMQKEADKKKEMVKKAKLPFALRHLKFSYRSRLYFYDELATLVGSGVPLVDSLSLIQAQEKNKTIKKLYAEMIHEINAGLSLAEAMEKFPHIFPKMQSALVEAAEASGNLKEVLTELVEEMEAGQDFKKKITGAMVYPIILVFLALTLVAGMMTFVIPKIAAMYDQANVKLPALTQAVIDISDFVVNYWAHLIISIFVGVTALILLFTKIRPGKLLWESFIGSLPVVGRISRQKNIMTIASNMAMLMRSGVLITEAFAITRNTVGNLHYQKALDEIRQGVVMGKEVSQMMGLEDIRAQKFKEHPLFPLQMAQLMHIGETTGRIADMLFKVKKNNHKSIDYTLKNISTLIEPVMIFVVAALVGSILMAVMLPFFYIGSTIS